MNEFASVRLCEGKERAIQQTEAKGGPTWACSGRRPKLAGHEAFIRICRGLAVHSTAQNCLSCEHSDKMFVAEKLLIPKHGELPTATGTISSSVEKAPGNTT